MITEPKPKCAARIIGTIEELRTIFFYGSDIAINRFGKFGEFDRWGGRVNVYYLIVDNRYDFADVAQFMADFGSAAGGD